MAQTRPSPTLFRGFARLGRFLAPYGPCSATRCRARASLPTDAGYGPRGEARADACDCLYCGWARRALSVRDTGH